MAEKTQKFPTMPDTEFAKLAGLTGTRNLHPVKRRPQKVDLVETPRGFDVVINDRAVGYLAKRGISLRDVPEIPPDEESLAEAAADKNDLLFHPPKELDGDYRKKFGTRRMMTIWGVEKVLAQRHFPESRRIDIVNSLEMVSWQGETLYRADVVERITLRP
ncbi:MAG: hypothetical protein Q7R67_02400 [bacterium]|nr:hypothetical protein [bacterium]